MGTDRLFRKHRGTLSDSMKTVKNVSTLQDIFNYCELKDTGFSIEDLKVEPYEFDDRIKWDTYIVTCEGYGVLGFIDGSMLK